MRVQARITLPAALRSALHPAQGDRRAEAWPALASLSDAGSFVAERVDVVASAGVETKVLASFELVPDPTTTKE